MNDPTVDVVMNDPIHDASDAELIARCLSADAPLAFDVLHARHAPCVRAFLHGFTGGDEHAVADCAQATWLRAYRALPRFDRERPLRPWLLTIAARVAIDAEARRRRIDVVDDVALAGLSIVWPDARADVRDAVEQLLREAATRVSPRKLEAFLLSRAHGLSHGEVAARTGSSLATVKRDLAEATTILAGLAEELGLMPERLAAAVVREPAAAGWKPPADGELTPRRLEQVIAFFGNMGAMVEEMRARPVEDVAQAQALVARFTDDPKIDVDEDEGQALSWAIGVVKRTARALLCADRTAVARLHAQAADELRELEARHEKTRLRREQAERALAPDATDEERSAGARERLEAANVIEVSVRTAEMFLQAADQALETELASGRLDEHDRGHAAGRVEMGKIRAQLDVATARLEALRRGDAETWFEHIDRTEAEERASVERARALDAAIARAGQDGDALMLGIPARNAALVRARLDDVVSALGHRVVMGWSEEVA